LALLLICGLAAAFPSLASAANIGRCDLEANGQAGGHRNVTALNIHGGGLDDGMITEWSYVGKRFGDGTVDLDLFKPGFETHPALAGAFPDTTSEKFNFEIRHVPANISVTAGEGIGVTVTADGDVVDQEENVANVECRSGDSAASGSYIDLWEAPFHEGLVPNEEGAGELEFSARITYKEPEITSVEPESGPAAGGTVVTIHGKHLANAQVDFPEGATKVPGQTPESEDTELKVITPEAVTDAPAELELSTFFGSSVLKHKFTYEGAPRDRTPQLTLGPVTNITQTSAQLNATVNVEGLVGACEFGIPELEQEEEVELECEPPLVPFGEAPQSVSAQVTGLKPGTPYHYFLEAFTKYLARSGNARLDGATTFKTLGIGEKSEEEKAKEAEKAKELAKELSGTAPAPINITPTIAPTLIPVIPPKGLVATIPVVGLVGGGSATATPAGVVPVKVSCPAGESSCIGSITLTTIGAVGASTAHETKAKKKPALTLATGSFTVAGGKTATVQLHLSSKGKALLKHSDTLHASATIVAHDSSGATHTTKTTITIHAAKTKHGG
jgi:IPT/TIG domain